ncbi:MAG: hypothetical protein KDA89_04795 [Planctomycetaceae bacterium]|nr:hypothetical protein [Planctomycetaceae bacterium]
MARPVANRQANAEKGVGQGLIKGILGASIFGDFGIGLAAMSEQSRAAAIAEWTGLTALSEKQETAIRLPTAFCKATEVKDAEAKSHTGNEALAAGCGIDCLSIIVITIVSVAVGNAVSYGWK